MSYFGLALLLLMIPNVACARDLDEAGTISPCPMPKLDDHRWVTVQQKRFTFRLPPTLQEVKVQGRDSWVRRFESADSSVSLSFDWGRYSDPLTRADEPWIACEEKIGGRKARVITLPPRVVTLAPRNPGGDGLEEVRIGAGAAWRDVAPGIHLTMHGWARDRNGAAQLLRIFRTVRFVKAD